MEWQTNVPARRPASGATDAELLRRFLEWNDQSAFAALVGRHAGVVRGVCRRILHDRHAAEDAVQMTFLTLASKAGVIRQPELLGNWLYGVAVRIAARARAEGRPHRHTAAIVAEPAADPDDSLDRGEEIRILEEELAALPDRHRLPLELCFLRGLTHRQAAARLGLPIGSMSRRLARACGLLRDNLVRRGVVLSAASLTPLGPLGSALAEAQPLRRKPRWAAAAALLVSVLIAGFLTAYALRLFQAPAAAAETAAGMDSPSSGCHGGCGG